MVADDVEVIYARIQQLKLIYPRRFGTTKDHCSHCPMEWDENCTKSCTSEGVAIGIDESEFKT
jgi:hypothetical protein